MKKLFVALLCALLAGLCACGPAGLPKELAPYNSVLKAHHARGRLYAFYDLDGDGTEELLLGNWTGTADEMRIHEMHTIGSKKAIYRDDSPWFSQKPVPHLFENGTIRIDDVEMNWIFYYRLEGGEFKCEAWLFDDVGYQQWLELGGQEEENKSLYSQKYQDKEDVPLTKEEFEQIQKDMEGGGQIVELDWTPLFKYRQG